MSDPLYVKPVPGFVVSRFGTASKTSNNVPIGHTRAPEGGPFVADVDAVMMIPAAEYARFRREYEAAIKNGELLRATAEDFGAQRKKQAEAEKKAEEEAAAAQEQAAKASAAPAEALAATSPAGA